ncbi:IS110 family transposase [Candidatus Obscuribacterales bacterium]|nr:IS110 family transposase [Candidatus Obscuribacterales bacterium]
MISLGIDISKETVDCYLLSERGRKLHADNSDSGFRRIEKWLNQHTESEVQICMEATGKLWEPLAEYFCDKGFAVSVVNPVQIKNFGKSLLKRSKTDAIDAEVIAQFCKLIQPKTWTPLPDVVRKIRNIERHIDALKTDRTRTVNRTESGRLDEPVSISLQRQIEFINNEILLLEQARDLLIKSEPQFQNDLALLQTIPGVGLISALTFLTEISGLDSFESLREVESYCGLTPELRESGTSVRGRPKMSKKGCRRLRKVFYMASLSAVRSNPAIQKFATKLAEKCKPRKVILCAAMRKLLRIMMAIYRTKTPFNPNHLSVLC